MKINFIKWDKITIIDKTSKHYRECGIIETLSINNPFALVRLDNGNLVKFHFFQMDNADMNNKGKMILKCPKCHSTEELQVERIINGEIMCIKCNEKGKYAHFNFRTQHLEKIYKLITQLSEKDLRLGQMFNIVHESLKNEGKDSFYIENDEFLTKLNKLIN